ncbi:MAG: hypothetical protein RSD57_13360, partial [Comamonas sp.]
MRVQASRHKGEVASTTHKKRFSEPSQKSVFVLAHRPFAKERCLNTARDYAKAGLRKNPWLAPLRLG